MNGQRKSYDKLEEIDLVWSNESIQQDPNIHDRLKILLKEKLRNDIYCQVIKQLNNNHKRSIYYLMMECNDFVFIHFYTISRVGKLFEKRRQRCLIALQSLMYIKHSGSKRPPILQDMTDILNKSKSVHRGFLEKSHVPSCEPLLKSFFD
ncbi:hypothetical protein RFI_30702 [Reticulomyxa filosa]|uniref:Uncharacterized protein n=1 Tax=Reticulomyxa filosa TaxID=46433 RepID=X6M132_RETFI|nr:hypothetical protein RFI_30702 [Reticulomyxa filosa]|eukprot:ETO06690.1 hypothetical protein RFI_30702 [Reticulomyxa filosa]